MQNAQAIYNKIQETKKKIKNIKSFLKDQYELVSEYNEIQEQLKTLRIKRKEIMCYVHQQYPEEFTQLEDLKIDLASDKELLNDIVLSKYMKGDNIELENAYQQQVLPLFSVTYKQV